MRLPFLLILFAGHGLSCAAADVSGAGKASIERCSVGSLSQSSSCLYNLYVKRDKELNNTYQKLVGLLENPKLLKNTQTTWIKFRDQSCDFETSGIDKVGSLYYYKQSVCLVSLTEKRIVDLKAYLSCVDLDCPTRITAK